MAISSGPGDVIGAANSSQKDRFISSSSQEEILRPAGLRGNTSLGHAPSPPTAPPQAADIALFARELYHGYAQFPFHSGQFSALFNPTSTPNPEGAACAGVETLVIHDWVQHCLFGRCLTAAADEVPSYCLSDRRNEFTVKTLRSLVQANAPTFREWAKSRSNIDMRASFTEFDRSHRFAHITAEEMGTLVSLRESLDKSGPLKPRSLKSEWKTKSEQVWEKLLKRASGVDVFTAECEIAKAPWVQAYLESLLAGKEPPVYSKQVVEHLAQLNQEYKTEPGHFENRTPQEVEALTQRYAAVMRRAGATAERLIARFNGNAETRQALAQQLSKLRQDDLEKIKAEFEQAPHPDLERIRKVELAIANPSPQPTPIPRTFWTRVFGDNSPLQVPETDYFIRKPNPRHFDAGIF